jgi:hypothetical protein
MRRANASWKINTLLWWKLTQKQKVSFFNVDSICSYRKIKNGFSNLYEYDILQFLILQLFFCQS